MSDHVVYKNWSWGLSLTAVILSREENIELKVFRTAFLRMKQFVDSTKLIKVIRILPINNLFQRCYKTIYGVFVTQIAIFILNAVMR